MLHYNGIQTKYVIMQEIQGGSESTRMAKVIQIKQLFISSQTTSIILKLCFTMLLQKGHGIFSFCSAKESKNSGIQLMIVEIGFVCSMEANGGKEKQGEPWIVKEGWGIYPADYKDFWSFWIGFWFLNFLFCFLVLLKSPLENLMHFETFTPVLSVDINLFYP